MESEEYEQTRRRLTREPVIWRMAAEIAALPLDQMMSGDGTPLHPFMMQANAVYRKYGGQTPAGHVGAVAEAIVRILVTRIRQPENLLSFWLPEPDRDYAERVAAVIDPPDETWQHATIATGPPDDMTPDRHHRYMP